MAREWNLSLRHHRRPLLDLFLLPPFFSPGRPPAPPVAYSLSAALRLVQCITILYRTRATFIFVIVRRCISPFDISRRTIRPFCCEKNLVWLEQENVLSTSWAPRAYLRLINRAIARRIVRTQCQSRQVSSVAPSCIFSRATRGAPPRQAKNHLSEVIIAAHCTNPALP